MGNKNMKRFKWWVIECTASLIIISSYITIKDSTVSIDELASEDYWVIYCSIVSVIISILGLLACIFPQEHNVCRVESILVWLMVILWTTGTIVAIIGPFRQEAKKTLFSSYSFLSFQPNVYFFSLWCLMVSLLMIASWFKEFVYSGNEWSTSTQWILLGAMSFFTMLSAINFRDETIFAHFTNSTESKITRDNLIATIKSLTIGNATMDNVTVGNLMIGNLTNGYLTNGNQSNGTEIDPLSTIFEALIDAAIVETLPPCEKNMYSCVRINYAIGLSAVSAVVACFMTPWKGTTPTCQTDISIVLFIFWLSSIVLLTVPPGPAIRAGNLYFGIYICYFLTLSILITSATCVASTKKSRKKQNNDLESNESSESVKRGDLWQAAYGKLERYSRMERDRSDSYGSLFDTPEEWDDRHESRIKEGPEEYPSDMENCSSQTLERVEEVNTRLFQEERDVDMNDSGLARQTNVDPKDWKRRVRRLELWCVLLTMSIVVTYTFRHHEVLRPRLVYTVLSISIFISCVGIGTCLRTSRISNSIQILSILIASTIWLFSIVIFLQDHNSHVFGFQTVEERINLLFGGEQAERIANDPNVFFGVWISIITVILLISNRLQASLITTDWLLFATSSVALLISSSKYIIEEENLDSSDQTCDTEYSITCRKVTFAKYLATASLCLSIPMTLLFRLGPMWHLVVSIPLVIAWGFGVPYVTFSINASTTAATYFAFWGGIFLSLDITTISFMSLHRNREKRREALNKSELESEIEIDFSADINEESVQSKETGRDPSDQDRALIIENNDSGELSQSTIEYIFDENQQQNDSFTETDLGELVPSNIESNFDDKQQQNDSSTETALGELVPSNIESNCDDSSKETVSGERSQPYIESNFDDNQQQDDSSAETCDFIDCSEHELMSHRFYSTRSTMDS